MGHKRLFLADLTDQHLIWLKSVLACSVDTKIEDWLRDILDEKLALYEVPGGIIGLRLGQQVFVELLAGAHMKEHAQEILATVKDLAKGAPVEGFVVNPAVVRFYERLGFKSYGTYMRLEENGRTS